MTLTASEFDVIYSYFVIRNRSGQDLAAYRILLTLEEIKQREEENNDNGSK